MKKFLKRITISATALTAILMPVALVGATAFAQADIEGSLCAGANLDVNDTSCSETAGAPDTVNRLIETIINIFSIVVGVTSVIMIIVGGFQYITSGGDSTKVTTAKNTILFAIIGLVIVALAQVIVNFVLSRTIDATS